MPDKIKLTIIIPTFNGENTIKETLESIFREIEDGVEVVICDNASTDSTAEVIQGFLKQFYQLRYYRNEENVGGERNYALAISKALGEYVWLFSDDDVLLKGSIKTILNIIDKTDGRYGCILTDCIFYNFKDKAILIDGRNKSKNTFEIKKGTNILNTPARDIIGVISTIIIKKETIRNWDFSPYIDTNHIQVGLVCYILCENDVLVLKDKLFLFRRDGTLRWDNEQYRLEFHFGFEYTALIGSGNFNYVRPFIRIKIWKLIKYYLILKVKNKKYDLKELFTYKIKIWKFFDFWVVFPMILIIYTIPSPFFGLLMEIFYKNKGKK